MAAPVLLIALAALGWRYGVPREAVVLTVRPVPFQREVRGPGILDALSKTSVSASIQGALATLPVDVGDTVEPGAVVATLAAADLSAQLAAAVAEEEAAGRAVPVAEADLRKAEAARANSRSTLDRQQALIRTESTTRSALEAAETALEQALADRARAEAAIAQAKAAQASATAAVKVAAAQLEKATLRTPIGGLVVARRMNVGDLVVPGTVIVEIVDPASVVLTARFDESLIAQVALGQSARLTFPAPPQPIAGTVRRLGREVDTETREFTVDLAPATLPPNWALGQRGTAALLTGAATQALTVPPSALLEREGAPGVFVVEGGRARWRALELGAATADRVEVRAGLSGGEEVLAAPDQAYPGLRITPREARP